MKKRLLIISDLWGFEHSKWQECYISTLSPHFELQVYDSCKIGEIDLNDYQEAKLHGQFVNGGIQKAVNRLLLEETKPLNILAFSIGGTIAWQFALKSNLVQSLVCVSSSRLRKENQKPSSSIQLHYGADDPYIPPSSWFEALKPNTRIWPNEGHQIYQSQNFCDAICQTLIKEG